MIDIRYACRLISRSPGFAAVAVVTLALGIGANAALFSLLDAIALKPMPFRDPERLVDIREVQRKGTASEQIVSGMTRERLAAWRAQEHIFEGIEAYQHARPRRLGETETTIGVARVSPGLFPLLGLSPALRRGFTFEEVSGAGAPVVILTHGFWMRVFGGGPHIIGRDVVVDGRPLTVVGVMPATARFPFDSNLDAWVPLTNVRDPKDPAWRYVGVVARLRPDLSMSSAQPALDAAAAAIQANTPGEVPWSAQLAPTDPRPWLLRNQPLVPVAFGAVVFLLLVACANVANLLLARMAYRRRELAVRAALGASRLRIVRQLLIEGLVLAGIGGLAATLLAWWLIDAIPAALPPRTIAFPVHDMRLDWRVLTFGIGVSAVVGILSSLLPALRGARVSVETPLAGGLAAETARFPGRARNVLLAAQIAFTLVMVTGAALLSASFLRMVSTEPGYRLEGLVAADLVLPRTKYPELPHQQAFLSDLVLRLSSVPGVSGVTLGTPPPSERAGSLVVEDREGEPDHAVSASILYAGPRYFETLEIPLLAGRPFAAEDEAGGPPVAIVDEQTARRFWPGEDPLGRRVRYSPYLPWHTIIGVVGDVKTSRTADARESYELYLPLTQKETLLDATVMSRVDDHRAKLPILVDLLRTSDPELTIRSVGPIADRYGPQLAKPRFAAAVMALFAVLALATTAVGLFGILSYAVAQRTAEIGLRMALGADHHDLRRLVMLDALVPVAAGIMMGLLLVHWLSRFVDALLYGMTPRDPLSIAAALLVLLLTGIAAAWIPARRATRVDPLVALRAE